MTHSDAASILASSSALLLDFDGPICSIFATLKDFTAADRMRAALTGIELPQHVRTTTDPLEVLRFTASLDAETARLTEEALCLAELDAATGAEPTEYADELIRDVHASHRPVAVVSNNSTDAIAAYLASRNLASSVSPIAGRVFGNPALMKPHPHLLEAACHDLGLSPKCCVLVGDSVTDIEAARKAGVLSIGYANRPEKLSALADAGADAVITTMGDLLSR